MKKNTSINSRYNDGAYLEINNDWHAGDSSWKANQIHKIINRNAITLNSICEIGCGAGEILRQLSLIKTYEQVDFHGYEISDDAFKLCIGRENLRLKFFKKNLLELDESYDAILCIDVFEHVENYIGFIKDLKDKGKYKIFHIPLDLSILSLLNGRIMHGRKSVGHLHYFTSDTALATLLDCGYEILDVMYTPSFADLPSKNWKRKLIKTPRKILYKISPKLLSIWLGGVSLMVLTK